MEPPGETPFELSDETNGVIVDTALALVEAQMLAQVAEDANIDGRTTGLLGFSGALAAATVAAKEPIGFLWFLPLVVLGAVTFVFLWILYGGAKFRDLLAALWRPPIEWALVCRLGRSTRSSSERRRWRPEQNCSRS
ncbi:MAG TPA: hypothetical protein VK721_07655 [Solirubrobacteraceae bacterium]|nr:hypothetical protein [Solirubrobacteraceae bacterium]